jgi:hypothetical protein
LLLLSPLLPVLGDDLPLGLVDDDAMVQRGWDGWFTTSWMGAAGDEDQVAKN